MFFMKQVLWLKQQDFHMESFASIWTEFQANENVIHFLRNKTSGKQNKQ